MGHTERVTAAPDAQLLRETVDAFIDRVLADRMIGFYFRAVDVGRLRRLEFEHAAEHFALPGVSYTGRGLSAAHRVHRIPRGHFGRRIVLLKEVLAQSPLAREHQASWINAQLALESEVVLHQAGPDAACPPSRN